jgi:hypothetical protein
VITGSTELIERDCTMDFLAFDNCFGVRNSGILNAKQVVVLADASAVNQTAHQNASVGAAGLITHWLTPTPSSATSACAR